MKFLGVASWRGWNFTVSDGMCADCAVRAREEWHLPPAPPRPAPPRKIRPILRPDFAFAAAVVVLAVAATVGVVVGPPTPTLETAAPRVDVAATPVPDQRGEASPRVPSRNERPTRTARPGEETAPSSGDAAGNAVASAPADDVIAARPSAAGGAAAVRRVADGPRQGVRSASRPARAARATIAQPVLTFYQPVPGTVAIDAVRAPEPRVVAVTPVAWRLYADASTHQAP